MVCEWLSTVYHAVYNFMFSFQYEGLGSTEWALADDKEGQASFGRFEIYICFANYPSRITNLTSFRHVDF